MKKNRFLFLGILALALIFGLVLTGCGDGAGGGGDDDNKVTGGGQTGRLTVNNLTGDTQNVVVYLNANPTTKAEYDKATENQVAFDGYDEDHKTPFDMRMSNETGEPVIFNKTGKYLVVVTGDAGPKFKAGVQFTDGSATVDYSTMTLITSLPGADN
jgi:hypothetical protein